MPRVVGIDHLVLTVGDFARSKAFYDKLMGFLGFKLKHEYADMAGWSNGKTAVVLFEGESSSVKLTGEAVLLNQGGTWRADDELTDVVMR